jgi:hypothetical protein
MGILTLRTGIAGWMRKPLRYVVGSPFRIVMALLACIVALEAAFLAGTPALTKYFISRNEKLLDSIRAIPQRWDDAEYMLPPAIGLLYAMQTLSGDPATRALAAHLATEPPETLARSLEALSAKQYRAVLAASYANRSRYASLEAGLLRNFAFSQSRVVYDYLARYRETAERSAAAGLVDDARVLYDRYLTLGRATGLATSDYLTFAQVELKALSKSQALRTKAWKALLRGSRADARPYLDDPDSGIRSLAIFEYASGQYREGDIAGALELLRSRSSDFGPLKDEFELMTAKLLGYAALEAPTKEERTAQFGKAAAAFRALAARLPDNHYLLDDVFYIWATLDQDPRQAAKIAAEGLRRCQPDADEIAGLKALQSGAQRRGREY